MELEAEAGLQGDCSIIIASTPTSTHATGSDAIKLAENSSANIGVDSRSSF